MRQPCGRGHFHSVYQQTEIVIALLQQINQISMRAGLKPKVI